MVTENPSAMRDIMVEYVPTIPNVRRRRVAPAREGRAGEGSKTSVALVWACGAVR